MATACMTNHTPPVQDVQVSSNSTVLNAAIGYVRRGLSVIPISGNKTPLIRWEEFQRRKASEEEIKEWWKQWPSAMIGLVTGKVSGLFVVDIDSEEGEQAVSSYLPENCETPTARTPRGGKHLYFQHNDSLPSSRAGLFPGVDIRGNGGYIIAPPSVNSKGGAYTWGISMDEVNPLPIPGALQTVVLEYIHTYIAKVGCDNGDLSAPSSLLKTTPLLEEGQRNETLFSVALALLKGGMISSKVSYLLSEFNERCKPPLPDDEVMTIFRSAEDRSRRHERSIQKEVEEFIAVTTCDFSVTNLREAVTGVTKEDRAAVRKALSRLCSGDNPIIERCGNKAGMYRKLNLDIEVMDLLNAPTEEFSIKFPLGVSDMCKVYPGNIVVVAGSKSSGKTAYLLNIVKENMNQYPIDYLNSEMGETELRLRLEAFRDLSLSDWRFRPIMRSGDWWDLITGEKKIYVIDFLEPPEDKVYLVGQYIRQIHKKLRDGICIVGLQKRPGRDTGHGDTFSMEKARLYLALDYDPSERLNRIKIVDAKAFRGESPRGLARNYSLTDGAIYKPQGDWFLG